MTTTTALTTTTDFAFPPSYSYPPFFTPQPTTSTRQSQLRRWSALIQSYCAHNRIFRLHLPSALESPLFNNTSLKKRIRIEHAREILEYMISKEGGQRAEWVSMIKKSDEVNTVGLEALGFDDLAAAQRQVNVGKKEDVWIWWLRPEEWASKILEWVEGTAQKGSVLTLYELVEGEESRGQVFHGLDNEVLHKALNILVKKGKAQMFGNEDAQGIKFF